MLSISSYFNPFSNEFNATKDFSTLTVGHRAAVVIVTALASLFLGVFATPVFRLLVGRLKKLEQDKLPPAAKKTHETAQKELASPTVTSQTSIEKDPTSPAVQKTHDPAQKALTAAVPQQTATQNNEPIKIPDQPVISIPATPSSSQPLASSSTTSSDIESAQDSLKTQKPPQTLSQLFTIKEHDVQSTGYKEIWKQGMPSQVTVLMGMFIQKKLKKEGKMKGTAVDNGDCFFHAFAQVLNVLRRAKGLPAVTLIELRQQVSEYVKNPKNAGVLQQLCDANASLIPDGVDYYKKLINFSFEHEKTLAIWGQPKLDGEILCRIHNVNLTVWGADIYDITNTQAKKVLSSGKKGIEKFMADTETMNSYCAPMSNDSVSLGETDTIEILGARKHFFPVFHIADVLEKKL